MTDWPETETVLERFRAWLGQIREESQAVAASATSDLATESDNGLGLLDLVREFTALRHEVKLQTKSARGLEEQTGAAIAAIEEASRQFRSIAPQEAEAAFRAALPLIEAMADLDEALARALTMVESARERLNSDANATLLRLAELNSVQPAWKRWLCRSWQAAISDLWQVDCEQRERIVESLVEGFALVRKRLERAMAKEGLYRLDCAGLPVDPHTMTVVEVVQANGHVPGTVVDEIRPGYLWNDKVVRYAEVRAARHSDSKEPAP